MRIILASASASRTRLLREAHIPHEIEVSGVDEESEGFTALPPVQMVLALAEAKAQAVALRHANESGLVIGADSTLEFQGSCMAKPEQAEVAINWWRDYSGQSGSLHTGQAVIDLNTKRKVSALSTTQITFARIGEEEIRSYVATGEPLMLAGGASLDGIGAPYISHINGDATGVLGISMNVLRELVEELGHPWHTLRAS